MSAQVQGADAKPGAEAQPSDVRRLSGLLFALLVIGTFGAFFIAQRLKHTPTAVQQFYTDEAFYPEGGKAPTKEAITFRIEHPDRVTVVIVEASTGASVATLAHREPLSAYTPFRVTWNGRWGAHRDGSRPPTGPPAPKGEYRVEVILSRQQVTRYSPTPFQLVREGRP